MKSQSKSPSSSNFREKEFVSFVEAIENGDFKIEQEFGICSNFILFLGFPSRHSISSNEFLKKHYFRWEKYSGDVVFPIPGVIYEYSKHKQNGTLWDKSFEYGRLRWELLYFIRDRCIIQIQSTEN